MTEYAIMKSGEIVNVCTTDGPAPLVSDYEGVDEIKRLDDVPLAVKQRYRYWNERP